MYFNGKCRSCKKEFNVDLFDSTSPPKYCHECSFISLRLIKAKRFISIRFTEEEDDDRKSHALFFAVNTKGVNVNDVHGSFKTMRRYRFWGKQCFFYFLKKYKFIFDGDSQQIRRKDAKKIWYMLIEAGCLPIDLMKEKIEAHRDYQNDDSKVINDIERFNNYGY
jgi:hypothetical protein